MISASRKLVALSSLIGFIVGKVALLLFVEIFLLSFRDVLCILLRRLVALDFAISSVILDLGGCYMFSARISILAVLIPRGLCLALDVLLGGL